MLGFPTIPTRKTLTRRPDKDRVSTGEWTGGRSFRVLVVCAALSVPCFITAAQTIDSALTDETLRQIATELPKVKSPAREGDKRTGEKATLDFRTLTKSGETSIGQLVWSPEVTPYRLGEVEKVIVIENGAPATRYWSELAPDVRRNLLSNAYTTTNVYEVKSNGDLSIIPLTSSLKKKSYSLVYNNFRYKDYPCSAADPGAGRLLVGVGLRVEARIKAKETGIGIGLPKLALSASRGELEGSLKSEIIGMAASPTLSEVVGASATSADYDSLVRASSAYSVANALLESNDFFATPHIVGFVDVSGPGSCLAALTRSLESIP
jgi:hypothetical protein